MLSQTDLKPHETLVLQIIAELFDRYRRPVKSLLIWTHLPISVAYRTVRSWLNRLEKAGVVYRPTGKRRGYALTGSYVFLGSTTGAAGPDDMTLARRGQ